MSEPQLCITRHHPTYVRSSWQTAPLQKLMVTITDGVHNKKHGHKLFTMVVIMDNSDNSLRGMMRGNGGSNPAGSSRFNMMIMRSTCVTRVLLRLRPLVSFCNSNLA